MRRLVLAIAAAALSLGVVATAAGAAEPPPPFDGLMTFPAIQGPADPEEFSWEVQVGEGEELRLIDDKHAGVFWVEDDQLARQITAQLAHDADGATVPTTLAVSEGNIVTLTVHHRAGNPAAGGAPFVYPVVAGAGWEGGFQTHIAEVTQPPAPALAPAPAQCVVPNLVGASLRASRKMLRSAHCSLGPVRGQRTRRAKVVRQYRRPGKVLPPGTGVGVKLPPAR